MDTVRRVATGLSGGMIIEHLDDATLIRLLRQFTGWREGAKYEELRKRIAIIERIEKVDLNKLVSAEEIQSIFNEIRDTIKYPLE